MNLIDYPLGEQENMDPYSMFVYGIRSPYTKESCFRRLRIFFDSIDFGKGKPFEERCNSFAHKARTDSNWAFSNLIRFLYYQKERVEKKEITAGTLRNYVKTLKMFCEVTDIAISWKKITRGLPKGGRFAAEGYRTISLCVYGDRNDPRYAAVMVKRPNLIAERPRSIICHG